ncbi:MAG TPA: sugar phosphate isomerase/epimerase [Candidatus Limnocylindrales bacterium]|nr:sugar phosphate isomerase/epimerase [Candidatus Limnocylindrales bacterium]
MSDGLASAPVGVVPILWNNVDLPDLGPPVEAGHVLDEVARLGFTGCQFGRGFPEGDALRTMLSARGLRLAERYLPIACGPDGPDDAALQRARDVLRRTHAAGGEVLVLAGDGNPERDACFGRVGGGSPRLTDDGFRALAGLVNRIGAEATELGCRVAFHPHSATWIETSEEVTRLLELTDATTVGICLDVGHFTVGGGDSLAALRDFGERVTHVHLKDVDAQVLQRVRDGLVPDFGQAVRERIFTEPGNGVVDIGGIVGALAGQDYAGWIMIEQDSTWLAPAEAAAIGLRVYEFARRQLDR